ncbi:MAG: universal stress protein [Xanthobacteraceae bacterium]|nr:universal stress protein [Xanthobacteraceae bacterium]
MTAAHSSPTPPGYASIMVSMDLRPDAEQRARLATILADRFGSRLIGIAAHPIAPPLYFETALPDVQSAMDLEHRHAAREIAKAEAAFRKVVGTRNRVEWRHAHTIPADFVVEQARAADLIVASRSRARHDGLEPMSLDAGDLVLAAGRPVLFVPPETELLAAKHIVIAWKDTREARRAVADAMPFLKAAEGVTVVTFGADDRGAADVGAYLACHGIEASVRRKDVAAQAVAAELMRVAEIDAADLIVCGAYGHSRASEWVFGGVTRDLLAHSRLCCLMAH